MYYACHSQCHQADLVVYGLHLDHPQDSWYQKVIVHQLRVDENCKHLLPE